MPAPAIRYPNSVFGYTGGDPTLYGDVTSFYVANGTIAAGNVVILDVSVTSVPNKVIKATASADSHLVVGVAAEAAIAGEVVPVVAVGVTVATSNTIITIGDRIGPDGTTAGNVATVSAANAVAASAGSIGIALQTVTAGDTSVRVNISAPAGS